MDESVIQSMLGSFLGLCTCIVRRLDHLKPKGSFLVDIASIAPDVLCLEEAKLSVDRVPLTRDEY